MTVPAEPTPPTWEDLVEYKGGTPTKDQAFATRKLAQAQRLTDRYVLDSAPLLEDGTKPTDPVSVVPPEVLYEAYLEAGSALWDRRNATTGTNTYDTIDGPSAPVLGDPLAGVYPDLDPYLQGGFS